MFEIRRSEERGHGNRSWLDSYHSFSFANYHDPAFMNFRQLRVINEDFIEAAQGFPSHSHRDMEIITYIIEGELFHTDSLGNTAKISANEMQRMTAGTGIEHSEFSSKTGRTHLLQIWIFPNKTGLTPGYEQKYFAPEGKRDRLKLVVSSDGVDESLRIHQDVKIYSSLLSEGKELSHTPAQNRSAWLQLIHGSLEVNQQTLNAGDGMAISEEKIFKLKSLKAETEFLLFDLA